MPIFHPAFVDENVDPPKVADHVSNALINRFRVSLVKLYRVAAPTSRPQHLNHLASARRFPYVGNSNVRTSGGESLRNRSPNIARPSGYQCDLSFEIHCSPQNPLLSPSASERQRSRTKDQRSPQK
jgi:hypothetical protein